MIFFNNVKDLVTISLREGNFFIDLDSKILIILAEKDILDDNVTIIKNICYKTSTSFLLIPYFDSIKEKYENSSINSIINRFTRKKYGVCIFHVILYSNDLINDETIYIGANDEKFIMEKSFYSKLHEQKLDWLYPRNDELTDDSVILQINNSIKEKGHVSLSTCLIMSEIGFKHLLDFIKTIKNLHP